MLGEQIFWTSQIDGLTGLVGSVPDQLTLGRQFFLEHTLCWNYRKLNKAFQCHEFRHKGSREVLWLKSFCKPRRLEVQLAALAMQMDRRAPNSNCRMPGDADPRRPAGYEMDITAEMVGKLCEQGQLTEAVEALGVLVHRECRISKTLFHNVLKACLLRKDLVLGRRVHAFSVRRGYQSDTFLCNHVVRMYASQGMLKDAMDVFTMVPTPDAFMWSSIITAHVRHGESEQAIQLYHQMRRSGVNPDGHVFVAALQACGKAEDLKTGQQVHADVLASGVEPDLFVCNCLVYMYAKCGSVQDAQRVFDRLSRKDVVTWTALIAGYSQQGMGQDALRLYHAMQQEGMSILDSVIFVCLLQACASVAALQAGKQLHGQIKEQGLQADENVGNSLINMYAKSGSMVDAQQVFDALPKRNVVAWTALINGYTRQGESEVVFDLLHRMREDCIQPDSQTFLAVLTVCSHAGLLSKGQEYFEAMRHSGITPTAEHYSCMVDLLGRAGQLDKALAMVRMMPVEANLSVWHTLLSACRKWRNVEVGCHAFTQAVKLDEKDPAAYLLMSYIYSGAQMWDKAQEMQVRRKEVGALKQPGQSWWTDMDGLVHSFVVGENRHPESEGIYVRLKQLALEMKTVGYVPHLDSLARGRI